MAHILAVDDDADMRTLLKTALERDGHRVTVLDCGAAVTAKHCRWADCILLDVMMPDEDGFSVCRRIRSEADCPVLFLTAKAQEADVLTGLGIGADDYLTKPFRLAELRARVNAHLRREQRIAHNRIIRGQFAFDLAAKCLYCKDNPVRLTKSEYALCEHLGLHAGQTMSKSQLYEAVFGFDGESDDSVIPEHIKNIRSKLRKLGQEPIETIWGVGYQWKQT